MTDRRNHRFLLAMLLGSAATVALSTALPARAATEEGTKVGTAAATKPGVTGTPPKQEKRVIEVGTNVLADERIVTSANSQAQLLFNDGSSFSVGPDSDIVIDKFVFDPNTGNGEMSLSVGKGVFRFVGGKISKNAEVQVKTPTATMGIRGGIATLSVQPGQPVVGKFLFGKGMTMTQNGVTQTTVRPGTVIEAPPGAPPAPPRPATPAEIRQTMSQLEAAPAAAPAAPAGGGGGGGDSGGGGQQQAAAPAQGGGDAGGGGGGQQPQQQQAGGAGQGGGSPPPPAAVESRLESTGISGNNSSVAPAAMPPPPAPVAPVQQAQNAAPPAATNNSIQNTVNNSTTANSNTAANTAAQNSNPTVTGPSTAGVIGRLLLGEVGFLFSAFNSNNDDATPRTEFNQGLTGFTTSGSGSSLKLNTTIISSESGSLALSIPAQSSTTNFTTLTNIATPYGLADHGVGIGTGTGNLDFHFVNFFVEGVSGIMFAGRQTTPAQFRTSGLGMHNIIGGTGQVPFTAPDALDLSFESGEVATISPLYSAYATSQTPTAVAQTNTPKSVALQASLGILGQGVDQESYLVGTTGVYVSDPAGGGMVLAGGVNGTYRFFTDERTTQVASSLSSASAGSNGSAIFGSDGTYMVLTPDAIGITGSESGSGSLSRTVQTGREFQQGDFNSGDNYHYTDLAVRQTTNLPSVLTASSRTARTLNGYASGLMEVFNNGFPVQDTPLLNSPNESGNLFSVSITTEPSINRVNAAFDLSSPSSEGSTVSKLAFGGANGAFINDRLFGARESNTASSQLEGGVAVTSSLMVTSDLVPIADSALPEGVFLCNTCFDLVWGWFVSDQRTDDGEGNERQGRIHMGTFVTGTPTQIANVPATGRASFKGHMIGNVRNFNHRYIAIGNYSQIWDFSTRTGMFQVTGFDGMSINGNVGSGNGRDFLGSLSSANARFADASGDTLGFFNGSLSGSFFSGGNGDVSSVGGQFNFARNQASPDFYQAAGTFAAGPAIVSNLAGWRGRYLRDEDPGNPLFTGFDNQNLSVTFNPANNKAIGDLDGTGTGAGVFKNIADQYLSIPVAGVGDFFLSFLSGEQPLTNFNYLSPFGANDGKMFINPQRTFFIAGGSDLANSDNAGVIFGGLTTPNSSFRTSGQRALQIVSGANSIPFASDTLSSESFSNMGGAVISPLFSAYSATQTSAQAGSSPIRSLHMQASMLISGEGSAQQSFLIGETGAYIAENGDDTIMLTAGAQGSARVSSASLTTRFASGVATANVGTSGTDSVNAVYGPTGENMVLLPDQTSLNSGIVSRSDAAGFEQDHNNLTGQDYYFVDYTKAMDQPGIMEAARTTRSSSNGTQLNGYMGGQVEVRLGNGTFATDVAINNATGSPTDFVIETDATTNRIGGRATLLAGGNTYSVALGSLTGSNAGHGAFVNDEVFAMRQNADDTQSTLNGNTVISPRVFMVSHNVVGIDASAIPSGVSLCSNCDFMSWGWWVADVRHNSGATSGQRDRVHLATWVAGTLPQLAEIPATGTASYSGHAIGNVTNGTDRYVAIGNFTKSWDFSTRTGAAAITSFDSKNVNFTTSSANGRDFSGTLNASGTTAGVNAAALAGSFFKGSSDPVKGAAGNFSFTATGNYQASGTFIAAKP